MTIHEEVLHVARRICRERGDWTFSPEEVARALPELNANSVRTHVVSRCCVNAPKNHPHKWDYFRRVGRGKYEIAPQYRGGEEGSRTERVAESVAAYRDLPARDSVHAVVTRGERQFVAECLEIAVVTQGRTLDEVVSNLRDAIALHLEGEDAGIFGLTAHPRLVLTYECALGHGAAAQTALR